MSLRSIFSRPASRGLALSLLLLGCALPALARWSHFAPVQAPLGQSLNLEFLDPEGMSTPGSALLFIEVDGRSLGSLAASELAAGRVLFQLPADLLDGRELSYRVEIRFPEEITRLPGSGQWRVTLAPENELLLVNLLSDPDVEPGEEALLAFSAADESVDLAASSLWIDGAPAPGELEADAWLVTWRGQLPAGNHEVELRLKDRKGRDLQPQRVSLRVLGASAVPTGFEASAWEEFNMDYLDTRNQAQWQRYHAGQLRFRAWRGRGEEAWTLKGRLLLSAQDVESDVLQPQSRVNLDLSHGGFLVGVGDRQPEYSPLLLSGTRVRGGELALDFKEFGLKLVGGRTVEARDPVYESSGAVDYAGAYARDLYSLDLRMGRRGGFLEGGMTLLKVKDDVESIQAALSSDSLALVAPEDNVGLGARLDVNAFKGHFSGRNQVAFALHNSDISGGSWTQEDLETLGAGDLPDPSSFENIIVINEYFSPLDLAEGDYLNSLAFSSNWQWSAGPNELLLDLRRVGGAYRSLGNSYLTQDQQELRITDRFRLLQNQLYFDLGGGMITDNLDGQYDETVGTTTRNLFNLGLGWYPKGRDLQLRLGLEQQQEANEALDILSSAADEATVLNAQSQHIEGGLTQIRLGLTGSLDWLARRHQWSVNLVNQSYGDDVGRVLDDSLDVVRMDRSFGSNQLGLGWQTNLDSRTRLDTGLSFFSSDYDDGDMTDYSYWNLRGGLGRDWLAGKLKSALRTQFQSVERGSQAFTRLDLGGEVDWTFHRGMQLSSRVDWQSWSGDLEDSFLKVVLRLTQEF